MEIEGCVFPDDLLYDPEDNIWIKEAQNQLLLGITCIYASFAGRLEAVKLKPVGMAVEKGRSVATVESPKFFGAVRTPVSGIVTEINENLVRKPVLANKEPYSDGWFAKIRPVSDEQTHSLKNVKEAEPFLREAIHTFRVRCFKVYPDYEISGIGGECPETLGQLHLLMTNMHSDESVHVVTDNPVAPIDVPTWVSARGYRMLYERREGSLLHYILGKYA